MFEIYVKMKKKKCWKLAIEIPNAWGGMPHLWMYLEKKYLFEYYCWDSVLYDFVYDLEKIK